MEAVKHGLVNIQIVYVLMRTHMNNPFKSLAKKDWAIWITSLFVVVASNVVSGDLNLVTLIAICGTCNL